MSIEVRGLCCGYGKEEVLRSVDFTARSGEVTVIIGSNGAGKTTLLRCILGLLSRKAGSILVGGRRTETLSRRESARLMAYVPQICFPSFNFRCAEIVMMGANNRTGMFSSPPQGEEEFALACMEKMGVAALRDRPFFETSGGERQLLLIARALMQKAPVLLLDEPVANLDFGNQTRVMEDIRKLAKEGYCVVLTSHNPEQTYLYADKVAALGDGRMLLEGTREEVVSEEVISKLYGLDVSILRLLGDRMRVCVPRSVCDE